MKSSYLKSKNNSVMKTSYLIRFTMTMSHAKQNDYGFNVCSFPA